MRGRPSRHRPRARRQSRARPRLRRARGEEDLQHGELHDHRGPDDQERPRGLRDLRQSRAGPGQRHPGHALLLRQLPRRREVPADRSRPRLLGRDHRIGQADRHRPVLRRELRHAREPERQGPEHDHHRAGLDRPRHGQGLRHDVPDRDHPRLRQRAEGPPRLARDHPAPRGDGRVDGGAPGPRVGGRLPGHGGARDPGPPRRRAARLHHRLG